MADNPFIDKKRGSAGAGDASIQKEVPTPIPSSASLSPSSGGSADAGNADIANGSEHEHDGGFASSGDAGNADGAVAIPLTEDGQLARAERIARIRHAGQTDKGGNPYIEHPKYVAEHVDTKFEKTVAWLHDTIEDTGYTEDKMRVDGFDENVIRAVRLLTHDRNRPYLEYIRSLANRRSVRHVKMADIRNNMDLTRIPEQERDSDDVKRRMRKYKAALDILSEYEANDPASSASPEPPASNQDNAVIADKAKPDDGDGSGNADNAKNAGNADKAGDADNADRKGAGKDKTNGGADNADKAGDAGKGKAKNAGKDDSEQSDGVKGGKGKQVPDEWPAPVKWVGRHPVMSFLLAALLCAVAVILVMRPDAVQPVPSNEGFALLKDSKAVESVEVRDYSQDVIVKLKKDYTRKTDKRNVGRTVSFGWTVGQRESLGRILDKSKYEKGYSVVGYKSNTVANMFMSLLPVFLIIGFMMYMMKDGALSGIGGNSQKDEKMLSDKPDITFKDVAGEDTALIELKEIKDMLAEPEKYERIGAKLPKGVLLYGPPGTGKTLLAKALAGEVDANFYYCAASDLVEMFVGLGARRIRNLFAQARKNGGKNIIFLDELDAIGGSRSNRSEGNSEREQTLNQLLVEMDGFQSTGNIIVLASTNRPDMLDKALLRPGRFDRQIGVDLPDMKGREEILEVHARNKRLADDVDLHWVARNTAGFSGAQLANVVNEAALMAIRDGRDEVSIEDMSEGIDRTLMGPKKTTREDYRKSLRLTAYHEAGHALAAMATPGSDPVNKITILPRSNALGYTAINGDDDRTNYTCSQLYGQLNYMLGGWAAEELVFGDVSTGPSNDIEKATSLSRDIITKYGFGRKLGIGVWTFNRDDMDAMPLSDDTLKAIDEEVGSMIHDAHENAMSALRANRAVLDELVGKLLDKETLTTDDLRPIIAKVQPLPAYTSSGPYHALQEEA